MGAASGQGLPRDIVSLVAHACATDDDRPAMIFEDGSVVGRPQLLERIEGFAGYLTANTRPGEHVAVMLPNRAEFMIAWIAAAACGLVVVAVNPSAGDQDARHVLVDSAAALLIVDDGRRAVAARLRPHCPELREVLAIEGPEPDGLAGFTGPRPLTLAEASADPEAVTNVYYTSGSTGLPKGCMLDHGYWLRFVDLYDRIYGLGRDDRLLTCLRFHYNDPSWHLLSALHAGTTFVAMRGFSVSRFWDVVRRHDITQLFGIASMPSLLLTAPAGPGDRDHGVRFAVQVGLPSPSVHVQAVERWGVPWYELYGLTETGILVAMPPSMGDGTVGTGALGVLAPEVEGRLLDEHDTDVPDGEPGELVVRAPGLMRGYLNRPEATDAVLRDGWFRTGDLLRRSDGMLHFVGRRKDLIRRGGENVAAAEVESVLLSHPGIAEAAVTPVPDDMRGEEVKAHLLLAPGETAESVPPAAVIAWCAERLAPHKLPRFIEYRDRDFPRTPSLRVAKQELMASDAEPRTGAWDREA